MSSLGPSNQRVRPKEMSLAEWKNKKRYHPEEVQAIRGRASGKGKETKGKAKPQVEDMGLTERLRLMELECKRLKSIALTHSVIRDEIVKVKKAKPELPTWLVGKIKPSTKSPGVPTLFASDWHWGEVVDPTQIGGMNSFDLTIAHARSKAMIRNTINLLRNHMAVPNFPGIVFALGGDMFSGDIHEELSMTNAQPIMPTFLDLYGVMIWCIKALADEFKKVFIPCVTGNHSRTTRKPWAKERTKLSFDWLLYCMLEKHFEDDARVSFYIPDGPDALYQIYNHKYLLTHGDQFRGGDGMIGALGPIIRGDHKKRSRNSQVGQEYDTLLLGHWHQLIQMQRLIVNGSLKGYDEYANAGNFGFEIPRQALWITHPSNGITFQMPVNVELVGSVGGVEWVSVMRMKKGA